MDFDLVKRHSPSERVAKEMAAPLTAHVCFPSGQSLADQIIEDALELAVHAEI
ncbi:hypothetical protein [Rhizobium leguminosarum]|uniref:hypothetical protein n=1 Tax=Rhizobium leguminosarum TaxID=384 RepID=UPI003D0111A5